MIRNRMERVIDALTAENAEALEAELRAAAMVLTHDDETLCLTTHLENVALLVKAVRFCNERDAQIPVRVVIACMRIAQDAEFVERVREVAKC